MVAGEDPGAHHTPTARTCKIQHKPAMLYITVAKRLYFIHMHGAAESELREPCDGLDEVKASLETLVTVVGRVNARASIYIRSVRVNDLFICALLYGHDCYSCRGGSESHPKRSLEHGAEQNKRVSK